MNACSLKKTAMANETVGWRKEGALSQRPWPGLFSPLRRPGKRAMLKAWAGSEERGLHCVELDSPLSCHSNGSVTGSQQPRCHGQMGVWVPSPLGSHCGKTPLLRPASPVSTSPALLELNPLFCSRNLGLVAACGEFHLVAWRQERGWGIDWPSSPEP